MSGVTRTVLAAQTMKNASVSATMKALADEQNEAKKSDPKKK